MNCKVRAGGGSDPGVHVGGGDCVFEIQSVPHAAVVIFHYLKLASIFMQIYRYSARCSSLVYSYCTDCWESALCCVGIRGIEGGQIQTGKRGSDLPPQSGLMTAEGPLTESLKKVVMLRFHAPHCCKDGLLFCVEIPSHDSSTKPEIKGPAFCI